MSAYVVDPAHITALVRFAIFGTRPYGAYFAGVRVDDSNASEIGAQLLAVNIASVAHRYPTDSYDNRPGAQTHAIDYRYRFDPMKRTLTPVEALKALDGYEYQACEHPGWMTSDARDFVQRLRKAAISKLPGYEDAEWEITE